MTRKSDFFVRTSDYFCTPRIDFDRKFEIEDSGDFLDLPRVQHSVSNIKMSARASTEMRRQSFANVGPESENTAICIMRAFAPDDKISALISAFADRLHNQLQHA